MPTEVITLADIKKLGEIEEKEASKALIDDYAVASLVVMRGLPRGSKLKIIRRMRKIVG